MSTISSILKTHAPLLYYCVYLFILLLIPGFLFSPSLYSGEFYKWTDEQGNINISDNQPHGSSYHKQNSIQRIMITDSPRVKEEGNMPMNTQQGAFPSENKEQVMHKNMHEHRDRVNTHDNANRRNGHHMSHGEHIQQMSQGTNIHQIGHGGSTQQTRDYKDKLAEYEQKTKEINDYNSKVKQHNDKIAEEQRKRERARRIEEADRLRSDGRPIKTGRDAYIVPPYLTNEKEYRSLSDAEIRRNVQLQNAGTNRPTRSIRR